MTRSDWLDWPFFEPRHRQLEAELADWCAANIGDEHSGDTDSACRALVDAANDRGGEDNTTVIVVRMR